MYPALACAFAMSRSVQERAISNLIFFAVATAKDSKQAGVGACGQARTAASSIASTRPGNETVPIPCPEISSTASRLDGWRSTIVSSLRLAFFRSSSFRIAAVSSFAAWMIFTASTNSKLARDSSEACTGRGSQQCAHNTRSGSVRRSLARSADSAQRTQCKVFLMIPTFPCPLASMDPDMRWPRCGGRCR